MMTDLLICQAMYASDMMGDHSIEHCQSLLLLSVMMVGPASLTDDQSSVSDAVTE